MSLGDEGDIYQRPGYIQLPGHGGVVFYTGRHDGSDPYAYSPLTFPGEILTNHTDPVNTTRHPRTAKEGRSKLIIAEMNNPKVVL